MQHVSVAKKWGLADSAACECGEEVGTGGQCSMSVWRRSGDWRTVQHVSVAKKWGLADSAACECGEEVGTGGQCSM